MTTLDYATTTEVIMWIKTREGEYYNLDNCVRISEEDGYTYFVFSNNNALGVPGEIAAKVVERIVWNTTRVLEVE